jgi:hypothetical protein
VKIYKGRSIRTGMKVVVYVNLHNQLFSIKSLENGEHYGKVVAHAETVLLEDCRFIVKEKGIKRIRERKKRWVVAWGWEPCAVQK